MKHLIKKWLCILLTFYASFGFAQVNVQDSLELIRFYHDVCIDCPLVWDFLEPVESWEGVTVAFGYLREINLSNEGLNGTLADWNFPDLFELHLENNSLIGGLLDFTGMSSLRELDLDDNQLSGAIPNFTNLLNLDLLDLNDNQFSGGIPIFTTMLSLQHLDIGNNQLTGSIPNFSSNALEELHIGNNYLSDTIPNFSNLPNLKDLYIGENDLVGNIPDFANLSSLEELTIRNNYDIVGTIPDFNLPQLIRLKINRTDVSGTIPDFSGITILNYLNLEENELTGEVPNFSQMPYLEDIILSSNELTGEIPSFEHLTLLEYIRLEYNELTGEIPDFNHPELTNINCKGNELTGSIPLFSNLPKLRFFDLSINELTDTLPHFTNPLLEHIRLNYNQLTGSIPDYATLPNIEEINLSDNLLSGCFLPSFVQFCGNDNYNFTDNECLPNNGDLTLFCDNNMGTCNYSPETDSLELVYFQENICTDCILWDLNQPMSTWQGVTTDSIGRVTELILPKMNLNGTLVNLNLSELQKIDLDSNRIIGELPCFSNLPNLTNLYMPDNLFEGEIPNYNLPNLISLNLSGNQLGDVSTYVSGTIRKSDIPNFSYLSNLEYLSLGYNQLNGYIPNFDKLPKLKLLFLSFNQLSGNVPKFDMVPDLDTILLSYNYLTGNIPSFSTQTNLTSLHLEYNRLDGCFPADLQNLCGVPDISITEGNIFPDSVTLENFCAGNITWWQCTGLVPLADSLELVRFYNETCAGKEDCSLNWDFERPVNSWWGVGVLDNKVQWLTTSGVGLSGTLPDLNLPYLDELNLENNYLSGQIPYFTYLDSLGKIYLGYNNFEGEIPDFNLPKLGILNLQSNSELEGELPNFSALTKMFRLQISRTGISGKIPDYSHMDSLFELTLHSNRLSGTIPNFNFSKLCTLNLASNRYLEGAIPNFDGMPELQFLSLGRNQLTDTIPNFDSLPNLVELGLYNNKLTGNIPNFIHLSQLSYINLARNNLTGGIPEFPTLWSLIDLDLSGNELTGEIPDFSGTLFLVWLDLDDNKLSGSMSGLLTLPYLYDLDIDKNYFTFDEIQEYLTFSNVTDIDYSPQYHGNIQSYVPDAGDTLTLRLSEPLPGVDNDNVSYQWKKEPNEDEEMTVGMDSIYLIENMEPSVHSGIYQVYMTDTLRVPDLEIISEPILLRAEGYDLQGEPVVEGELIVEFSDWESKTAYEEQFLNPSGGEPIDSCNCNRLIYLWSLPDNAAAYNFLLDINTNKHSQNAEGDADGGFNNILDAEPISGTQGWTWRGNYPHVYNDSVTIFLLDSGTDTLNWDADTYLIPEAPLDDCYGIAPSSGFDYTDTLNTITPQFIDSTGHGTYGMRTISEHTNDFMNMKIVPLKVFEKDGKGTLFDFICALYHAIDHGADIINVSAGYSGQPSKILENALIQARLNEQFIVTAAGNEGVNLDSFPQYPAYYSDKSFTIQIEEQDSTVQLTNVISVAAINSEDSLWQNSNYSASTVTLSAYGENMSGYSHLGEEVSYSGTSIGTYYVTKQLATEIARNNSRELDTIWQNFKEDYLRDCPATEGLTQTGKCLDIQLQVYGNFHVFLEGAFDITGDTMRTDLNTLHRLLPGQTDVALNHTAATQPYDIAPFNYNGTESVPSRLDDYPPEVVDWVLVSARTDTSTVSRTAAWLLKDGQIQFLQPLFDELHAAPDSIYIVIEHRNHMGVMSPEKLPVKSDIITWDFTTQDSYTSSSTGQAMLNNLRWGMLAGDANNDFDINGDDKVSWVEDNGKFTLYLPADFDMNGDVNGNDKAYWFQNNGKFSSVPQY